MDYLNLTPLLLLILSSLCNIPSSNLLVSDLRLLIKWWNVCILDCSHAGPVWPDSCLFMVGLMSKSQHDFYVIKDKREFVYWLDTFSVEFGPQTTRDNSQSSWRSQISFSAHFTSCKDNFGILSFPYPSSCLLQGPK